jgi:potassium channel subfamily K
MDTPEVLARRLAIAIRSVASDLKVCNMKKYSFEEWAEITRLIRFTSFAEDEAIEEEEQKGIVEWDWLGENSPLVGGQTEPEFVLDRLCESLGRYMRRVERVKKELDERFGEGERDLLEGEICRNRGHDEVEKGVGYGRRLDEEIARDEEEEGEGKSEDATSPTFKHEDWAHKM